MFQGLYLFSVAYCPFDKPVEKGIALVKLYIREHEDEAVANPVAFINEAFKLFAIGGERSSACMGHWNRYKNNYENFINEI